VKLNDKVSMIAGSCLVQLREVVSQLGSSVSDDVAVRLLELETDETHLSERIKQHIVKRVLFVIEKRALS